MTEKPTVFEALTAVMEEVRGVGKHQRNTAPNGNYNFRGIDAVTNAVGPALRKHGVIVAPKVVDWNYGTVIVGNKQTQMSHSRLLIEFTWYGPNGDSIVTVAAGEAFDSGDKATAKAHSVAFRTAMLQTLCLPTDERDPDEDSYERSATPPAEIARQELLYVLNKRGIPPIEAEKRFADDGNGVLATTDNVEAIKALTARYRTEAGVS